MLEWLTESSDSTHSHIHTRASILCMPHPSLQIVTCKKSSDSLLAVKETGSGIGQGLPKRSVCRECFAAVHKGWTSSEVSSQHLTWYSSCYHHWRSCMSECPLLWKNPLLIETSSSERKIPPLPSLIGWVSSLGRPQFGRKLEVHCQETRVFLWVPTENSATQHPVSFFSRWFHFS